MRNNVLLAICLSLSAPLLTPAQAANGPGTTLSGEVLEVKDVESYTYLRLKTAQGETWAAVGTSAVKKGANVTVENVTMMSNFESKSLKKTFQTIAFGNLAGAGTTGASPHPITTKTADAGPIKVSKATGPNARTVADIVTKAVELKDKPVLVAGKVVKYNPGIMGKNWIHLQDGTGTAAASSNDVLVTTTATAAVGDVVTVSGVVRTNKDFGAGYVYKVLIEEASLKR